MLGSEVSRVRDIRCALSPPHCILWGSGLGTPLPALGGLSGEAPVCAVLAPAALAVTRAAHQPQEMPPHHPGGNSQRPLRIQKNESSQCVSGEGLVKEQVPEAGAGVDYLGNSKADHVTICGGRRGLAWGRCSPAGYMSRGTEFCSPHFVGHRRPLWDFSCRHSHWPRGGKMTPKVGRLERNSRERGWGWSLGPSRRDGKKRFRQRDSESPASRRRNGRLRRALCLVWTGQKTYTQAQPLGPACVCKISHRPHE